jgi:arabinose operon protein AraL
MFSKYEGFIFDLDGTIYRGQKLINGARETVNTLTEKGKDIIFVSNKTTETAYDYYRFLSSNGLNISRSQIVTSTESMCEYFRENNPTVKFFAIGEEKFITELTENGASFSKNPEEIEAVIITLDKGMNFEKLEIAARALENGARFFAANIDDTCPVDGGEITDAGSIITALEKRTGKKLEDHFGKPSGHIFEIVEAKMKFPKEKYLIVGDRLLTDIKMGNDFGIDTALVSTGVKNFFDLRSDVVPTYEIPSVAEILKMND